MARYANLITPLLKDRLNATMDALDLTNEVLARRANLATGTISKLRNDQTDNPGAVTLYRLARAMLPYATDEAALQAAAWLTFGAGDPPALWQRRDG